MLNCWGRMLSPRLARHPGGTDVRSPYANLELQLEQHMGLPFLNTTLASGSYGFVTSLARPTFS